MQKTTIQIQKITQEKLKRIGTMNDTYDTLISRLVEEHELLKRMDFFVEAQHEVARKGRFVELD